MAGNQPDIRVRLSAEGQQEIVKAFRQVQKQAEKTGKKGSRGIKLLNSSLKTLKRVLPSITVVATAAAAAILLLTKRAIDNADRLAKMSKTTGIAVETLSALQPAAELAGSSIEDVATGLQRLARTASDAQRGLETAKRPFRDLGIEVADANGQLRPLEQILDDVARALIPIPDGTKKVALAQELMGRSGAKLIPLLNDLGVRGFAAVRKEAEKFGVLLSAETAKAAEDFNDNLTRLGKAATGLSLTVAKELLPHLNDLTDWAVNFVTKGEGAEQLAVKIAGAFKTLGAFGLVAAFSLNKVSQTIDFFTGTSGRLSESLTRLENAQTRIAATERAVLLLTATAGEFTEEQIEAARERLKLARAELQLAQNLASLETARIGPGGGGFEGIFENFETVEQLLQTIEKIFAATNTEIKKTEDGARKTGQAVRKVVSDIDALLKPLDLRPKFDPFAVAGTIKELQEFVAGLDLTITPKLDLPLPPPPEAALLADLGQQVGDQFASGFSRAVVQGEELRGVIQGIAQDLVRMLAQRALSSLFGSLFGGFLGPAGGGGAPGAAGGGLIHGPGSGTSDSIPVRLSRGEYVVRAAVVNEPDVLAYLDRLNREGRPVLKRIGYRGFAEGGLVQLDGAPARAAANGKADLTIGLDETLLLKRLEASPMFSRVLVRTLDRHRKKFNNALGRGVQ